MPYRVEAMQPRDIPEVVQIEKESFSMPWPANSYRRELEQNRMARYIVARYTPGPGEPPPPAAPAIKRPFPLSLLPLGPDHVQAAEPGAPVVGYGGLWLMSDEAHVTSIAVRPGARGKGLGELLMLCLIDLSLRLEARWVTLEVRVSNTAARALYQKLQFREAGIRQRYYTDNDEDAVIMWSPELRSSAYREHIQTLQDSLTKRLSWTARL